MPEDDLEELPLDLHLAIQNVDDIPYKYEVVWNDELEGVFETLEEAKAFACDILKNYVQMLIAKD